jgi:hypothetical protein
MGGRGGTLASYGFRDVGGGLERGEKKFCETNTGFRYFFDRDEGEGPLFRVVVGPSPAFNRARILISRTINALREVEPHSEELIDLLETKERFRGE